MRKPIAIFLFLCSLSILCQGQTDTIKPAYQIYDTTNAPAKVTDTVSNRTKKAIAAFDKTVGILWYTQYNDRKIDRPLEGPLTFEPFKGKRIHTIRIEIIYPFGTDLDNMSKSKLNRFQAFANKVQFKTKPWVIQNELLFAEGDALDPNALADTERNLWVKNVYKDIKFDIQETDDGQVDIVVYVRDRWNWSLSSDIDFRHFTTGPEFNNMFGFPQAFSVAVSLNYRLDNLYTINAFYRYSNIVATHIDATITSRFDNLKRGAELTVSRAFFSGQAQWGGRVILNFYDEREIITSPGGAAVVAPNKVNYQDFWIAKTFQLPGVLGDRHPQFKLIAASRLVRNAYTMRPYLRNADHTISFLNQTYILGAVGFAQWDYYVDHNVYTLVRAEYFPKGLSAAVIGGFQDDEELHRRLYIGAAVQYGYYFPRAGYLISQFKYGGFSVDKRYEQVLIDFQNSFYTIHQRLGKYSFRHIINLNARWGANRPAGRELIIDNFTGLRGFYSNLLRGSSTYALDYEVDFFAPRKILGFTSSMFLFADLAIIQQSINENKYQPGVGAGFRFRNVNLGFDFIQLMVAYYPALNLAAQPSYNLLGSSRNDRNPLNRNLFEPTILSVD
jgi:hypothetical protein